ncbi:hypothetical protein P8452_64570 [Trifolium repens]|nr:hypothetical protein P8452_64570 [Trifolium repens]
MSGKASLVFYQASVLPLFQTSPSSIVYIKRLSFLRHLPSSFKFSFDYGNSTALVMMWWSVALNFDDSIEAQFGCSRVNGVMYLMEALNWMTIGNNFRDLPSSFKFSLIMIIQPMVVMWWPVSLNFGDPIEAQVRTAVRAVWRQCFDKYLVFSAFNWLAIRNNLRWRN